VLLLAVIAAVLVPALSGVVRHFHLGLFTQQVMPELDGPHTSAAWEAGAFVATPATEAQPAPAAQSPVAALEVGSGATHVAWRTIALWAWAAATVVLLGRLLFAFVVGIRLARRARPLSSGPVVPAMRLAKARLEVNQDLQIRADPGVRSPVIWCWGRQPVLLLPDEVSGSEGGVDWAGVIAHELAHWKRGDHVTGLLAELAVCALPWNPFLWLSKRRLVSLTEQACDDWVVASGQPAEDYAESLLDFQPQNRMAFVPAVVHNKKGVAARVRRILNDACGDPRAGTKWALTVTVLVACVAVGFAFAQTRPAMPDAAAPRQEEPTSQTMEKPFPNSEKPEQPRFAARTFNAKTEFYVHAQETSESPVGYGYLGNKYIGQTPSAVPLEIPACWLWYVSNPGPVQDRDALIREIRESGVPGLEWNGVTNSDIRRLVGLTELRHLGLTGNQMTDAGLEQLKGLTRLESLRLYGPQVTDAGLGHLRGLTGLRSLSLGGPKLTEAGVEQLIKALPELRTLALSDIPIANAGLQHLTSLRKLDLSFRKITDTGLAPLKDLTTLRELTLTLEFSNVTDAGLAPLEDVTALRKLDLWGTKITDAGLAHLQGLSELRELWLNGCTSITDAGLAHLKGLTKLQRLRLNACYRVTGACLQYLSNMPELQELHFAQGPVTDADLQHLKNLTGLVYFSAKGPGITDAGLENFKALPRLSSLELRETEITDAGLERLKSLTALGDLTLQNAQITDAGLAHLKDLTKLTGLGLRSDQITDAGLAHLEDLTKLKGLDLHCARITDAGLEHLKGLTALHSLDFRDTPISGTGFAHLKNLTQLQVLELDACPITDAGLAHIGGFTSLWILRLQHIPITDTGLEHLRTLTGLRNLDLRDTRITGAGLRHLQSLTGLRSLYLDGSSITDAGLESIKALTGLMEVHLWNTQITDAGLAHLKGLTKLQLLDLWGTRRVTDTGIQQLKQSLPNLGIGRD
jgi:beta-lactamase regulating signal transducer with metallopeptidase domain/Leucine-rich repeat (LRR) protein